MSTGSTQPFRPAGTASVAATTIAQTIALVGGGNAVLVYNASSATAFFSLGGASGLTASMADTPVPAGARMLVGGGPFVSHAATLLSAGSGSVYFTLGDGDTY
ncbi:MAG: hypothetical protein B7Z81_10850 [Acidocella sp. 20-61-6]|nr:MAG: hypothetical protein B7Z81_10850 [Acidocella sp. 20-61-6]